MTLVAKWEANDPGISGPNIEYGCTAHKDENGDNKCDKCNTDIPTSDEVIEDSSSSSFNNPLLSVVSVQCVFYENQYSWNGSVTGTKAVASISSGVIYKLDKNTGDAYIITNYHAVYHGDSTAEDGISDEIYLFLYGMEYATADGKNYAIPAEFVGGAMSHDIAVLKVTGSEVLKASNATAAPIADSDKVAIFDKAVAVGNPQAEGLSATSGTISNDSEEITLGIDTPSGTAEITVRVMRTDAAVNKGNSGGGLFNERGELIGIVNAKISDTSVENIGYAIPASIAIPVAENIIDNCHEKENERLLRPMLGITLGSTNAGSIISEETGLITKIESVVISQVSYGALAGDKLAVGDVVTSIKIGDEEMAITRTYHVIDMMLNARLGDTVEINILRAGQAMTIFVEITQDALTEY